MNFLRYCLIAPVIVSGALFPLSSYAETVEPYVVTASRFEQQMNQVGSDVTVITAEEIRDKQITTLADALRHVPGIRVAQNGNGTASFYARGSQSDSVLVLINGIPVTDVTALSMDASLYYLANADKVEVVLGAQSALYGADALAGVINIVTKKGNGPANGSILIGAGAPAQILFQANANGSNEKVSWSIGLNSAQTNLFSTTNSKSPNYTSDFDSTNEIGFNSSLISKLSENLSLLTGVNLDFQENKYDDFSAKDDSDLYSQYKRTFINIKPELTLFDGFWVQHISVGYTNTDRKYYDGSTDVFKSQTLFADWQNRFTYDVHNIALGLNYKYDEQIQNPFYIYYTPKENYELQTYSVYGEYSVNPFDTFHITLAGRLDKGENFDNIEPSGSLALNYTVSATGTELNASGGRSFKAPKIEEYLASPNIDPERAYIFDIGVNQPLLDNKLELSVLYFNALYEDMIVRQGSYPNYTYINVEKMEAQGVEVGIYVNPIDELTASFIATFQDTKDHSTDKRQFKQADIELLFDIDYLLPIEAKDIYVGASVTYIDDRDDEIPATSFPYINTRTTLDAYTTVDLRAKIYLEDNLALSLKLNNIFDEQYEETYGYNTLGFNGFASVEYTF